MPFNMNIFRILGDVSHIVSKCILIFAIHANRSAEGVSLITQALYLLVFSTRYLDLFWTPPFAAFLYFWNFCVKIFYIASSAYIIFLMMRVFARTREREKAWKLGGYCLAGSVVLAPLCVLVFEGARQVLKFSEVMWAFSIVLESVCVVPQLLLLRQTTVPTVIDSFYLVTLGSYRFFYLLNWIVRYAGERYFDPIAVVFGIVQTALYVDFAYVYWFRQRVKLRNGGVVDSEDLGRGWLIRRFQVGRKSMDLNPDEEAPALGDEEVGSGRPRPHSGRSWGARGISVSADEGVYEAEAHQRQDLAGSGKQNGHTKKDEPLSDPTEFEDGDEDALETDHLNAAGSGVGNGSEWRDDHR